MFEGISDSNKLIFFNLDARRSLKEGVDALFSAVSVTMGPKGNNVVIERPGATPILTKDGVTVASAVNLKDRVPNLGAQMVKESAARTADVAGDGTTTATVLAHAIFEEGMKHLSAGASSVDLKKGIDRAVGFVIDALDELRVEVSSIDEIRQVATISANSEKEIGNLISDAIQKVGKEGVVTVEEAKGFKTSLNIVDGMQFKRGYLSPYFVNKPDKSQCVLENPYVLITNRKLNNIREILGVLEKVAKENRPILIIADEVDGDAMQGLIINSTQGSLTSCAITAPEYGEARTHLLGDIASMLGGEIITHASGKKLEDLTLEDLGTCDKIIVDKRTTTFIGGGQDEERLQGRIEMLNEAIRSPSNSEDEKQVLRERVSRLMGGIAVIYVGGATEIELGERKDRVDDALHATQAAIEEGILPGGGAALAKISSKLDAVIRQEENVDIRSGMEIIKKACCMPLKIIARNSGVSPDWTLQKLFEQPDNFGYDAYNNLFCNMFDAGIVDPAKVTRCALENAASAGGMMLTVDCVMIED